MDFNKLKDIDTFIFDVDGVLTNGTLIVTDDGGFLRTMYVRDGSAMKTAINNGYRICIITKGASVGVKKRLEFLGANPVYDRVLDKMIPFRDLVENHGVDPQKCIYMGDDLADAEVMQQVAISTCPNDADHEIIKLADFVSPYKGGEGCVRDIIEKVLRTRGDWKISDYDKQ